MSRRIQYSVLAVLLIAAVTYQVRNTMYRFPTLLSKKTLVGLPFLVLPDSRAPQFTLYLLSDSPLAGLRDGQVVSAIDGKPLKGTAVFGEALRHGRPGDSLLVTTKPGPRTVTVPLVRAAHKSNDLFSVLLRALLLAVLPWLCVLLGFWVGTLRPQDGRAWLLLAMMLSFAGYFNPVTESWGPWLRDFGTAYHSIVTDCLTIWLFLFSLYFPEPFRIGSRWARWSRWKWAIITPLALEAAADLIISIGSVENYAAVFFLQRWFRPFRSVLNAIDVIAVVAMFFCLALKFQLAVSTDAKRRLRVLFAGAVLGLTPILVMLIISAVLGVSMEKYFPEWMGVVGWLMFFLFPLTLAYVIVVHRAMDVRVVIRQGMQYTVARGGVRALRLAIGIPLGLGIVSLVQHQQQNSLFSYLIIGIGVILWFVLRRLLETLRVWVDRHFFRDAYNAEQLLSELSENVRSIVETKSLLATVGERISEALHVSRMAVLTAVGGSFQPAYAIGYESLPAVLFGENAATVRQLRQEKEPTRVYWDDPDSWIHKSPGMSGEEHLRLAALTPELLLPLAVKEKLLGFISLGPKRSEEPYSLADLRLLRSVATQTGLALEIARLTAAMTEEVGQRERLNRELEIAREVQQRLFPQELPSVAGLDICGVCRPALGVGGDYYDFLVLPEGKLGVALGDVAGKGIAAALTMASLQASLRAEAPGAESLPSMMRKVNRLLYDATAVNRYATFFYAQYEPVVRRLDFVNAGHNPPLLFRACAADSEPQRLDVGGTVLGLMKDYPYGSADVVLEKGDLLVAFTDGITETMNAADEEWGEASLIQTVRGCCGASASETIDRIMSAADAFAAGAQQHDDMTLVVLRVC